MSFPLCSAQALPPVLPDVLPCQHLAWAFSEFHCVSGCSGRGTCEAGQYRWGGRARESGGTYFFMQDSKTGKRSSGCSASSEAPVRPPALASAGCCATCCGGNHLQLRPHVAGKPPAGWALPSLCSRRQIGGGYAQSQTQPEVTSLKTGGDSVQTDWDGPAAPLSVPGRHTARGSRWDFVEYQSYFQSWAGPESSAAMYLT